MNRRILLSAMLALSLSACGSDEPASQEAPSFGGQLGDSYQGMLDQARLGIDQTGENMRRTDQLVRERYQ